MMLEAGTASLDELRRIFADIRRIDLRAADIIQRLRTLLRKKEFDSRPIDINAMTRETVALLTPVARRQRRTPRARPGGGSRRRSSATRFTCSRCW